MPTQGHDERRVFRLCCTCHRLYDHDIIKTSEVVAAENAWAQEARPKMTPWFQTLSEDVVAGLRDRIVAAIEAGTGWAFPNTTCRPDKACKPVHKDRSSPDETPTLYPYTGAR